MVEAEKNNHMGIGVAMTKWMVEYNVSGEWFRTARLYSTEAQARIEASCRREPTRVIEIEEAR